MTTTPVLGLDELAAAQSQPHVPINRNSRKLEVLVQGTVAAIQNAPPGSPADGARYIVGNSPTGAFAAHDGDIAYYSAGWQFVVPEKGWLFYVANVDGYYTKSGDSPAAWVPFTTGGGGGGSSLTVEDLSSSPGAVVTAVTTIEVQGGTVDSPSAGVARIIIPSAGGGSSPLTTKGDLFGHSTTDVRVPIGSDGDVLTADSGAAAGLSWQPASGGGGGGDIVDSILAGRIGLIFANQSSGSWYNFNLPITFGYDGGSSGGVSPTSAHTVENEEFYYVYTQAGTFGHAEIVGNGAGGAVRSHNSGSALTGGFRIGMVGGFYCPSHATDFDSGRIFMGLSASASNLQTADPSGMTDMVGIGHDSADTDLQFMINDGAGVATKVSMGITASSLDGHQLKLDMTCPHDGSSVTINLTDVDSGTVYTHTFSSNIPTADAQMLFYLAVGTLANVNSMRMYLSRLITHTGA